MAGKPLTLNAGGYTMDPYLKMLPPIFKTSEEIFLKNANNYGQLQRDTFKMFLNTIQGKTDNLIQTIGYHHNAKLLFGYNPLRISKFIDYKSVDTDETHQFLIRLNNTNYYKAHLLQLQGAKVNKSFDLQGIDKFLDDKKTADQIVDVFRGKGAKRHNVALFAVAAYVRSIHVNSTVKIDNLNLETIISSSLNWDKGFTVDSQYIKDHLTMKVTGNVTYPTGTFISMAFDTSSLNVDVKALLGAYVWQDIIDNQRSDILIHIPECVLMAGYHVYREQKKNSSKPYIAGVTAHVRPELVKYIDNYEVIRSAHSN